MPAAYHRIYGRLLTMRVAPQRSAGPRNRQCSDRSLHSRSPPVNMQLRLMEIGQVESWRIRRVPPDFTANALGVQGSGWSVLASDSLGQRLVLKQLYDQQGNLALATVPLLLLDM
jgi:hypothetical protein